MAFTNAAAAIPSSVFEILSVGTLLKAHAMFPSDCPTFEDTRASYKHLWSRRHPEVFCSNLLGTFIKKQKTVPMDGEHVLCYWSCKGGLKVSLGSARISGSHATRDGRKREQGYPSHSCNQAAAPMRGRESRVLSSGSIEAVQLCGEWDLASDTENSPIPHFFWKTGSTRSISPAFHKLHVFISSVS